MDEQTWEFQDSGLGCYTVLVTSWRGTNEFYIEDITRESLEILTESLRQAGQTVVVES